MTIDRTSLEVRPAADATIILIVKLRIFFLRIEGGGLISRCLQLDVAPPAPTSLFPLGCGRRYVGLLQSTLGLGLIRPRFMTALFEPPRGPSSLNAPLGEELPGALINGRGEGSIVGSA
jgi:hypothetical protein